MKCPEVQERLSAWLDGESEAAEEKAMEAHLQVCARCRAELAALERLQEALAGLEAPVPEELGRRVLARLPRRSWPWQRTLSLAASLIIGVILGGAVTGSLMSPYLGGGNGGEVLAFEAFHDFPQGSWGEIINYPADEDNHA